MYWSGESWCLSRVIDTCQVSLSPHLLDLPAAGLHVDLFTYHTSQTPGHAGSGATGLELLELVQQRVGRRSGQLKLYCGAQDDDSVPSGKSQKPMGLGRHDDVMTHLNGGCRNQMLL